MLQGKHRRSWGVSFDGYYGFPIFDETSSILIVTTAPGYHTGVVVYERGKKEKKRVENP